MTESCQRIIQAEDLYQFQLINGCEISPDGRYVIFAVQYADHATEKRYTNLWLASTDGRPARQFTFGEQNDRQPQWSPDGRAIAFLSNRKDEKQPQLYRIPIDGGEARPLTDLKGSIESFQWSPDGRRLVCAFRRKDAEALERDADEQKKKLGVVARHITRVTYKADGIGFLPQERLHVWLIDAETGAAQPLTDGDRYDEIDPIWSPDGQSILFCSNRDVDPDFHPEAIDIYTIPPSAIPGDESSWRKIETPLGAKSLPSYSPDGQWVAYLGREGRGDWWKHDHLWIVPFDGDQPARDLTSAYDYHLSHATLGDLGSGDTCRPRWSPDGQTIYVQVSHHGRTTLHAVTLDPNVPNMKPVFDGDGVVGAFSFDQSHRKLAYFYVTPANPGQIRLRTMASGDTQPLTACNQEWLPQIDLGELEEVWFKGPAGNDLQGWILKPPGFDPALRYPSIMQIHGGPLAQYGFLFMHEFYFLAANGYVVCFANPRGGYGYGEEHARAIWNDVGGADYDDLMTWADYISQLPYIDTERMGVAGGSYGGLMVNWIIGHTHRFKAAVSMRSITNRFSSYGSSDVNWQRQQAFGDEPPWDNPDNYWRQSPLKYIGNAQTPTLVIHSENDMRTPIEQGEQLFVALKVLGVDTEMIRFPDESHGLSRTGRTDRRIVRLQHILRWFDKYLKPV